MLKRCGSYIHANLRQLVNRMKLCVQAIILAAKQAQLKSIKTKKPITYVLKKNYEEINCYNLCVNVFLYQVCLVQYSTSY